MNTRTVKQIKRENPGLSHEALLGKALLYTQRALRAKESGEEDAYQLWAALALELLAKASLAKIHPSLVVETTNTNSLLEANGISTATPVRTVDANIAFARLKHTVPNFGSPIFKACEALAGRRNAELHSGQAACVGISLETWEGDFWSALQLILRSMDLELDRWLGRSAAIPKELLKHLSHVKREAAKKRLAHAKVMFDQPEGEKKRTKAVKDELRKASKAMQWFDYRDHFKWYPAKYWKIKCPACEAMGFLAGEKDYEQLAEDQDDMDPGFELVETTYSPVDFFCPTCKLGLEGTNVLAALSMDDLLVEEKEREIEYGPEYGND